MIYAVIVNRQYRRYCVDIFIDIGNLLLDHKSTLIGKIKSSFFKIRNRSIIKWSLTPRLSESDIVEAVGSDSSVQFADEPRELTTKPTFLGR